MFPTWISFSCNFLTVFNDGTAKTLISLTGTIKVFFNGKLDHKDKWIYFPVVLQSRNMLCSMQNTSTLCALGKLYNIPVSLWLKESYPRTAPICYLKPTSEMVVVTSKHVNSNGEILMPYLDEWRHVRLLKMLQWFSHATIQMIYNFLFVWGFIYSRSVTCTAWFRLWWPCLARSLLCGCVLTQKIVSIVSLFIPFTPFTFRMWIEQFNSWISSSLVIASGKQINGQFRPSLGYLKYDKVFNDWCDFMVY